MDEKVVAVISSVAIVNLLLASIVCWFNSFRHRYYFWLGWLIFSAAFAMINNLHIYLGYGNIWIYHISLLLNVSYGAYLVFLYVITGCRVIIKLTKTYFYSSLQFYMFHSLFYAYFVLNGHQEPSNFPKMGK